MQKFKVGDMVEMVPGQIGYKKKEPKEVFAIGKNGWIIFDGSTWLHNPEFWQLVEPKQRTIEEVRVGDITVEADNKNPAEVVEVLKNIFAYLWNDSVQWITFKRAKELDWKIKQPEPEELEHECTTLCIVACHKRKAQVCTHCGK